MAYDIVILGGGAAGLFCAMHAGRRGRRVLVVEHNDQPGKKILISGGGRCNFTNRDTRAECFVSANPHFAKSALARYTPGDFVALVERHGIRWHEKTLGQLFCDDSARQIVEMLLRECREAGVEVRCGARVRGVERDGAGFAVGTGAETVRAEAVVVATGGPSIPKIGATGFGYEVARQFGLRVVPPRPGLVPLMFEPGDLRRWEGLAGVATEVRAQFGGRHFDERLLFTHRGVSGPAVLQISSYWQPGHPIRIDLAPGQELAEAMLREKRENGRGQAKTVLRRALPERLAAAWADDERPLIQVPDLALRQLGERLHAWEFTPAGTEGFAKAEVAVGGVDTAELSSKTMEARRVAGLYFIGECVDVTGWLGGYNFQWAWASGYAAAQSA
ncbi:MAG: NAD(P)/FAD-dependent oxidoreductase [Bryobacterales bacterium]|nr:NAD(P)/FAD-dependent oxidoreductase [Bryobacterales bacterium]